MNKVIWTFCLAAFTMTLAGCKKDSTPLDTKTKERIGVYDSRVVAAGFTQSELFKKWLSSKTEEHEKAKAAGDQEGAAKLEAEPAQLQESIHKQFFSTAPIDNILEKISDRLPAIRQKAGVSMLVSKWDKDTLAKHPSAESVDVTMELLDALGLSESQKKSCFWIQSQEPTPLNQAKNTNEH